MAVRDSDYPAMRYFPDDADLARAFAAYGAVTRANGAHWDARASTVGLGQPCRIHRGGSVGIDVVFCHP